MYSFAFGNFSTLAGVGRRYHQRLVHNHFWLVTFDDFYFARMLIITDYVDRTSNWAMATTDSSRFAAVIFEYQHC